MGWIPKLFSKPKKPFIRPTPPKTCVCGAPLIYSGNLIQYFDCEFAWARKNKNSEWKNVQECRISAGKLKVGDVIFFPRFGERKFIYSISDKNITTIDLHGRLMTKSRKSFILAETKFEHRALLQFLDSNLDDKFTLV